MLKKLPEIIGTKVLCTVVSFATLFSLTACALPFGNTANTSDKDDFGTGRAQIEEGAVNTALGNEDPDQNNPDNPDTKDGGDENENKTEFTVMPYNDDVDLSGFSKHDPNSFASRSVGVYEVVDGEDESERVEIYNIGNNLYAFYSGIGFYAMEIFPVDDNVYFSDTGYDSVEVKTVEFSMQSNFSRYWDNGEPTYMNMELTDDGVTFTVVGDFSGVGFDKLELKRVDEVMGFVSPFDYRDLSYSAEAMCNEYGIETRDVPEGLISTYILLGDTDTAYIVEFTEEGLVQIFQKSRCHEIILFRGTYAVGKETVEGGNMVYLSLKKFGDTSENHFYTLNYYDADDTTTDGWKIVQDIDNEYGPCILWNGATLLPMPDNDYGQIRYNEEERMNGLYNIAGVYRSDDDDSLFYITAEGEFSYYPDYEGDTSNYDMGTMTKVKDGVFELTWYNQKTKKEEKYGKVTFVDAGNITVEFANGSMKEFYYLH